MLEFLNKSRLVIIFNCQSFYTGCRRMYRVEDNRLFTFSRICDEIAEERSYLNKAQILEKFFKKGCNNKEFKGDLLLWVRMLIPSDSQRVYNLQNKQMLKLFSRLFNTDTREMQLDLEQGNLIPMNLNYMCILLFSNILEGDVSETLRKFFENSNKLKPQKDSSLYLQDVEEFLVKLEQRSKEDEQTELLKELCKQATSQDLKTVWNCNKIYAYHIHILNCFLLISDYSYNKTRFTYECKG